MKFNNNNPISCSFTTNVSPVIEQSIQKLDTDARRSGRVSVNEVKNVLSQLSTSRNATSTQALMILRCCGNLLPEENPESRTELVNTIWKALEKSGTPLDISHYNALLRVYLENEYKFSPTDFLAQLEAKGIVPNRVTYQRLISRYCQDGDINGATRILEFMKEKNFPISEGVFNALILGHSQSNDMKSAEGILNMMKSTGLEPSAETFTVLMCGYAKNGDIEAVKRILNECDAALVNSDYLELIYALAVNGQAQHVDEILSRIQPSVGYSADASNYVYRLVTKGQIETAFKIVKSLARPANINGELLPSGGFLVKHLIRTNQPTETVLDICQRLVDENLHPYAFKLATQVAMECADLDYLVPFLKEFKAQGNEIRLHFFWPLLVNTRRTGNSQEILRILKTMEKEFGIMANAETIREYVMPEGNQTMEQISTLFNELRNLNIPVGTITSAFVINLLSKHKIVDAAKMAQSFRARYPRVLIRKVLIPEYLRTRDLKSLITIVHAVHLQSDKPEHAEEESQEETHEQPNVGKPDAIFNGNVILDIYNATKRQDHAVEHLEEVLNAFVENGLTISNFSADYLQNNLQSKLTEPISVALSKLTSEELTYQALSYSPSNLGKHNQNPENILRIIQKLEGEGENVAGLKRNLLTIYIRQKDEEKAIAYCNELQSDPNFEMQPGLYALLLELCADNGKREEAVNYYTQLKEKFPDTKLDNAKTIKLAFLFLQNDQEQDAIDVLKQNAKIDEVPTVDPLLNGTAWRLLNLSAEKTNPVKTKQLFELLRSLNYVQPNNILLGSILKAHILKEDYTGALEQFEEFVKLYRATPWKGELMRHFIDKEDAASLQRITDLSTSVHGEVNSLYDLMLSFMECGRLRQARKILETPGMRLRPDRLTMILDHYTSLGSVDKIEKLLQLTQDIVTFDRGAIYLQLLNAFAKEDQVDKALGLWTQMQEENETPSEVFLFNLAQLLKKHDREIPFSVPKLTKEQPESKKKVTSSSSSTSNFNTQIKQKVPFENLEEGMSLYKQSSSSLNIVSKLNLLAALSKENRTQDADRIVSDLTSNELDSLKMKSYLKNALSYLTINQMKILEPKLSDNMKTKCAFYSYLMKSAASEGNLKEYLNTLENDLNKASTEEEKKSVVRRFPMGGILGTLEVKPEFLPEITNLSKKCLEHGLHNPMTSLVNYYYMNGLPQEAENLFNTCLSNIKSFRYSYILAKCREMKSPSYGESLLKMLKQMKDLRGLSHVYSHLIFISINNDLIDEGIGLLERAVQDNATELLSKRLIAELQGSASKHGKTIPLSLINKISFSENKLSSSSSSSDSSDDEEVASQSKK